MWKKDLNLIINRRSFIKKSSSELLFSFTINFSTMAADQCRLSYIKNLEFLFSLQTSAGLTMMVFNIKLKSEFYRIPPFKDRFYIFCFDHFPEL